MPVFKSESLNKPPVTLAHMNDTEGVQRNEAPAPAQGAVIPPAAVPWLTGLVAVALVVSRVASPHTDVAQVAGAVTDVAVLFGLLSPGMRRK
jgi:hypothetical protein